jgi:hypothetical protein
MRDGDGGEGLFSRRRERAPDVVCGFGRRRRRSLL